MLVSELRELLASMPDTARVVVLIQSNVSFDGGMLKNLIKPRKADPWSVDYSRGEVLIRLEEWANS